MNHPPKNSKILIKQKVKKDNLTIYFVDQGPGISDNIKNKVFERFYTDRDTQIDKHSGLGLSIAKKIIDDWASKHHIKPPNLLDPKVTVPEKDLPQPLYPDVPPDVKYEGKRITNPFIV